MMPATTPEIQVPSQTAHGAWPSHSAQTEVREVRVRMEGAPWLSLRDRCGAGPTRWRHQGSRGSSWRSLSRLEVAMALVLASLAAAVLGGAPLGSRLGSQPSVASSEASTPVVAASFTE